MANQTIGDLTAAGVVTDDTLFEVQTSAAATIGNSVTGSNIQTYVGSAFLSVPTYDPAGISEQVVGLTATQTLTNKTLTAPTMTLVSVTNGTITGVTITGGSVSGLATDIAIADGGTGASDAATARANLGAGDMDASVYDPAAIAQQVVGTTATQTVTNKSLTSPAVTGTPTAAGSTWADLGSVTTIDINGGTINGITDLAIVDGGTGASTAADARDNLGLTIDVDVQAFDANTAKTDETQTFTQAQRGDDNTLTSTANSIAIDASAGNYFTHTLTENTTLANPSNLAFGQSGCIFFTQDAATPRTLAYGTFWDFDGGTAPTAPSALSAVFRLDYVVRSTTSIHAVLSGVFS